MSDKPATSPVEAPVKAVPENGAPKALAAPKALPEQNPAFKAMGMLMSTVAIVLSMHFECMRLMRSHRSAPYPPPFAQLDDLPRCYRLVLRRGLLRQMADEEEPTKVVRPGLAQV